ncbi:alpha/beta fold hydrolase [Kitasatospora cineracea]|uniref:alpha/beta fold hydrolase n=1 Tax=Kitasatospora cineracea TaxID=88074 RepID=UPI0036D77B7A
MLVDSLAGIAARDHWTDWAALSCPTLLVLGQGGIIPPAEADRMLALRPEVRAVSVRGAGHDVHLEQPAELLRLVGDFLREAHSP